MGDMGPHALQSSRLQSLCLWVAGIVPSSGQSLSHSEPGGRLSPPRIP